MEAPSRTSDQVLTSTLKMDVREKAHQGLVEIVSNKQSSNQTVQADDPPTDGQEVQNGHKRQRRRVCVYYSRRSEISVGDLT
jgi:hypothetical protein